MENFRKLTHPNEKPSQEKEEVEKEKLVSTNQYFNENISNNQRNNYDPILKSNYTENDSCYNSKNSVFNNRYFDQNSKILQSIQSSPIWKITSKIFSSPECQRECNILFSPVPEEYKKKDNTKEKFMFENLMKKKEIKEYKIKKKSFSFNIIKIEKSNNNQSINNKEFIKKPLKKETKKIKKDNKKEIKVKKLKRLYKVLKKIFFCDNLQIEDLNLKIYEMEILNYILYKKFKKKLSKKEMLNSKKFQFEKIRKIIKKKSQKRPEECFKFILTRAIKSLKNNNNFSKENFYIFYFKQSSKDLNIDIINFYYPLTCKKNKKKQTLNSSYFELIFNSKIFIRDIEIFIKNFYEDYRKEANKKIKDFLLKWDSKFSKKNKNNQELLLEIKNYLYKNSRCKLAWTNQEVDEAILRVITLINFFKKKNKINNY